LGDLPKPGKIIQAKIDIIRDHQVEETIAIVIAKRGAGGPAPVGDTALTVRSVKVPSAVVVVKKCCHRGRSR